jgi:hypothetical protein
VWPFIYLINPDNADMSVEMGSYYYANTAPPSPSKEEKEKNRNGKKKKKEKKKKTIESFIEGTISSDSFDRLRKTKVVVKRRGTQDYAPSSSSSSSEDEGEEEENTQRGYYYRKPIARKYVGLIGYVRYASNAIGSFFRERRKRARRYERGWKEKWD